MRCSWSCLDNQEDVWVDLWGEGSTETQVWGASCSLLCLREDHLHCLTDLGAHRTNLGPWHWARGVTGMKSSFYVVSLHHMYLLSMPAVQDSNLFNHVFLSISSPSNPNLLPTTSCAPLPLVCVISLLVPLSLNKATTRLIWIPPLTCSTMQRSKEKLLDLQPQTTNDRKSYMWNLSTNTRDPFSEAVEGCG